MIPLMHPDIARIVLILVGIVGGTVLFAWVFGSTSPWAELARWALLGMFAVAAVCMSAWAAYSLLI